MLQTQIRKKVVIEIFERQITKAVCGDQRAEQQVLQKLIVHLSTNRLGQLKILVEIELSLETLTYGIIHLIDCFEFDKCYSL